MWGVVLHLSDMARVDSMRRGVEFATILTAQGACGHSTVE
jgi:hypothetical protein